MAGAAVLRRAGPNDQAGILELNREGNGEDIKVEMEVAFAHGAMAPEDYAVAVVDGEVVSCVGLLATTLRVGSVRLPVGQPEYVATGPAFQGRGLAGRLLGLVQQWSEARGDLLQMIAGVAYFYRQYGYDYGLIRPAVLTIGPEVAVDAPVGWDVRAAESGDIDRIRVLQAEVQARSDVALEFADNLWPAFLAMKDAAVLVATWDGRVESVARVRSSPGRPVYMEALAASVAHPVAGLQAVLSGARARYPGATLAVADRHGVATHAVAPAGSRPRRALSWVYLRVPSLARVLTALIPVLDERLQRSAFEVTTTDLVISLYRSAVALRIEQGHVIEVAAVPAVHEPDVEGGVGIPPDLVPLLLFGEAGVLGIEDHPDVYLGAQRPLVAALFPALRIDALTW